MNKKIEITKKGRQWKVWFNRDGEYRLLGIYDDRYEAELVSFKAEIELEKSYSDEYASLSYFDNGGVMELDRQMEELDLEFYYMEMLNYEI